MSWIAGIDVGGTFTDLIALDTASGAVRLAKVPTTPENQAYGVLAALDEAKLVLGELALIVHGTTTTTNALLERKLAKTGLITTRGFRDVLELGRRTRPRPYGLTGWFEPLIPRELRLEVPERMDAEGLPVIPLDEAAVRGRGAAAHRRGLRIAGDPLPAQLHQPGARAARARDCARVLAEPLHHRRPHPAL